MDARLCTCGARATAIGTRVNPSGQVRRRRRCDACGARWTTVEVRLPHGGPDRRPTEVAVIPMTADVRRALALLAGLAGAPAGSALAAVLAPIAGAEAP